MSTHYCVLLCESTLAHMYVCLCAQLTCQRSQDNLKCMSSPPTSFELKFPWCSALLASFQKLLRFSGLYLSSHSRYTGFADVHLIVGTQGLQMHSTAPSSVWVLTSQTQLHILKIRTPHKDFTQEIIFSCWGLFIPIVSLSLL